MLKLFFLPGDINLAHKLVSHIILHSSSCTKGHVMVDKYEYAELKQQKWQIIFNIQPNKVIIFIND